MRRAFTHAGRLVASLALLSGLAGVVEPVNAGDERMVIVPASGPCDAAVTISLLGFEPGSVVVIDIGRPFSDDLLGVVGEVKVGAGGSGTTEVSLGDLGCEAARLQNRGSVDGARAEIVLFAGRDDDSSSASAKQTFTYDRGSVPRILTIRPDQEVVYVSIENGHDEPSAWISVLALPVLVGVIAILVGTSLKLDRS